MSIPTTLPKANSAVTTSLLELAVGRSVLAGPCKTQRSCILQSYLSHEFAPTLNWRKG